VAKQKLFEMDIATIIICAKTYGSGKEYWPLESYQTCFSMKHLELLLALCEAL
jgi:hypothetical protein